MITMDIFESDAFSARSLTAAIEKVPTKPGFLGSLNIFTPKPVRSDKIFVEERSRTLELVSLSKRGDPLTGQTRDRRTVRGFVIDRLAEKDTLYAHELAGLRAFGSETDLETVQEEVMVRQKKLMDKIEMTMEYHRLHALQGILLDADGSTTVYNYFTEFGGSQPAEIDFDLDNATPAKGVLLDLIKNSVKRPMIRALGGLAVPGMRIMALCGDTFYDQLVKHNDVLPTYQQFQAMQAYNSQSADVFNTFRFGGIEWVNYRGTDDNSTVAVGATKAHFFPVGVPDLFQVALAPYESLDFVGTLGRPYYAELVRDMDRNHWVQPEIYSYPLHLCTRPDVLLRGKNT